jgi:hypothetical protein
MEETNMNKKKLLALLMALVMTLSLMPMTVIAEELGTVTPIAEPTEAVAVESVSFEAMNSVETTDVAQVGEDGYSTLQDAFAAAGLTGSITLLADIDLNNENWTPIGTSSSPFMGTFDGNNHTISNLSIEVPEVGGQYAGLFGYIEGGSVENLNLVNVSITNGDNPSDQPEANYGGRFGAVVGLIDGGSINNCTVTNVTIQDMGHIGGIAGANKGSVTITNCTVSGNIVLASGANSGGGWDVGGILGKNQGGSVSITGCTVNGTGAADSKIYSNYAAGGILGYGTSITISGCTVSNVMVEADSNYYNENAVNKEGPWRVGAGGIIGSLYGNISGCRVENIIAKYDDTTATEKAPAFSAVGFIGASSESGNTINVSDTYVINSKAYWGETPVHQLDPGRNTGTTTYTVNYTNTFYAVASINDTYYPTLQAAIDDAQDGDTIELLQDITLSNAKTIDNNSTYGVAINKSLTLDGKNFTITSNATRTIGIKGASAENKISVTIKNLTINNSNAAGSGIFTRGNLNSLTMDNVKVYCKSTSGYNQPLTISGNRDTEETNNTANIIIQNNCYLQSAPNCEVGYAVINWVPANISITGSTIKGWACLYAKPGSNGTTFTVDNSSLISSNQNAGNTNSFGVIVFEDNNVTATVTNTAIDVSGTKNTQGIAVFNTWYADRSTLFYEGTNYNLYYLDNTKLTLGVGNTVIMKEDAEFATISANDGYYWCGELEIKGGIFDKEPDAQYIADGYKAVALTTGDNAGKFQVGPAEIQTTVDNGADTLTYIVNSVVKESDESDVPIETTNNMTVTVEGTDSEKTNSDGSSVGIAALENIKEEERVNIVKAAVEAAGSDITSDTEEANIVIQLAKSAPEKETNKVTFEVHPEAVITVAGSNKSTTVALSNEQLDNTKPFAFTLDVSALGVANGDSVKVTHKHSETESTVLGSNYQVQNGKITISGITSFSEFIVEKVDNTDPESPTVTLTFNGTSLRRRVRLDSSVATRDVVRSSTDARFGYTWDLPEGYSVKKESSYFEWSRDGKAWNNIPMTNFNGNTANLVITGIPDVAFDTPIYTRFTLAYTDGDDINGSITLTADARSVRDVANSLKGLNPNVEGNPKWIDYAKYLLGEEFSSYRITGEDGSSYIAE